MFSARWGARFASNCNASWLPRLYHKSKRRPASNRRWRVRSGLFVLIVLRRIQQQLFHFWRAEFKLLFGHMSCCGNKSGNKASRVFKTVKRGLVGLLKAAVGIDPSSEEMIQKRTAQCLSCEHRKFGGERLTGLSYCKICRCRLESKIKIAGEDCPVGRWRLTTPQN